MDDTSKNEMDLDKIEKEFADLDARRQAWIDALRGDEYKQGHSYLISGGYCCCIGVATCVIEVPTALHYFKNGGANYNDFEGYQAVMATFDLKESYKDHLIAMNDAQMRDGVGPEFKRVRKEGNYRNFKFIARWLEIVFALEKMPATVKVEK